MNDGAKRASRHEELHEDYSYTDSPIIDITDEVQSILSKLDPYYRSLIVLYTLCDMTLEEIAGVLEVSYGTARSHYRKAIEHARCAVRDMRDDAAS
jgi:RNA polymerase sigma factor (sigma-70 family)